MDIDIINVKIMVLGDSEVGKSQLFSRLVRKTFRENYLPTSGIDFATHMVKISTGKLVKAQIVDTSGLERFRPIIQSYWALATGALVVYDITNRESFMGIRRWIRDFKAKSNKGLPPTIMVVGNKAERESEPYREVTAAEAQAYALAQGFFFMEVSALEDRNVELAFGILLTDVYHAIHDSQRDRSPFPSPPLSNHLDLGRPNRSATSSPIPPDPANASGSQTLSKRSSNPSLAAASMTSSERGSSLSPNAHPVAASVAPPSEDTLSRILTWVSDSFTAAPEPTSPNPATTLHPASAVNSPLSPAPYHPPATNTARRGSSSFWPFAGSVAQHAREDDAISSHSDTSSSAAAAAHLDGAARAQQALAEALANRPLSVRDATADGSDDDALTDDLDDEGSFPVVAEDGNIVPPPRRHSIRATFRESGHLPTRVPTRSASPSLEPLESVQEAVYPSPSPSPIPDLIEPPPAATELDTVGPIAPKRVMPHLRRSKSEILPEKQDEFHINPESAEKASPPTVEPLKPKPVAPQR
ncbi:hypothetical protein HK101_009658, partial [Irineochytrium annulatum]